MKTYQSSKTGAVLEVRDIQVSFNIGRKQTIHAVSEVSFKINREETLGLVGESGCGKSSLARAIMQLPPPISGQVFVDGYDLSAMDAMALRGFRSRIQMVFQDPASSLNPGRRVGRSIAEPLRIQGVKDKTERISRVRSMMAAVGLDPEQYEDLFPSQLSGGQCQRVSIARALMTRPDMLICDESVSALDVSVQAQILNLLNQIKVDFGLAMLFISHDLAVVKRVSDRVAVMYKGTICELAPVQELYSRPTHPYTVVLLNAVLQPLPGKRRLADIKVPNRNELSSSTASPCGCRFHPRCSLMKRLCAEQAPRLSEIENGHFVACHFPYSKT
ncbi:ABC transporter ATP-binding protein [Desulfogranum mediterraneum]|uniref:ABC transporter ATP-binding protein n=1 Tax=Desulfogranum mediterraneum TaxID=160661 RepID=UPI000404D4E7|nr:ABC transporter ATP-binding protein [Desulfogranum mediterraneum]